MSESTVWITPSATSFSCLCELCLEHARTSGILFTDAVASATVRGDVGADAAVAVVHCSAGHEIVLRRIERPAALSRHDDRQLQLS